jgi:tripeptide aminopeptidase
VVLVNHERLTHQFLQFIKVDSPFFAEAPFGQVLGKELTDLGLIWTNDGTGEDGSGNLLAVLPGTDARVLPILLCMHMDTVEPGRGIKPQIRNGQIISDGRTILGADNKAAVVASLEAVRWLQENRPRHGDVELLFTWGEERGHRGSKAFDYSRIRSKIGFVPDGGGSLGTIITQAPYYESLYAVFHGRAAHAGISPEAGINAIVMAAQALTRMPLGRLDEETTANLGWIKGGSGRNTVPEQAEIEGEVRSLNLGKLRVQVERICKAMESAAAEAGGKVSVTLRREYDGYAVKADELPTRIAAAAARSVDLVPALARTCGGSDANEINAHGISAVVLGMGGGGYHTCQEHISISELGKFAEWLAALAIEAGK